MRWLDVSTENCSVQAALDVVGAKWSMLVIREMFNGVHRFDEMQQHVGISEAVLSRRLRELQDAGLVESIQYREPGMRTRREYRLTAAGLDLFPVLIALLNWGDKHRAPVGGGSWQVRHRDCGEQVAAVVACPAHPGVALDHRDTVTNAGPTAVGTSNRSSDCQIES
ncbi:helix-turn-helix transcriptional regulator [Gordonia sp. TBRC 11910]|uniref:Helix-turn-helix transcriptional regulator n=1 Tax=Gordonia asplenii TaxID=2725283 RepID=A0A848L3K6_9ACTN|nr:helix-turn-helix domain-containing protein [Gordonia asplenii]NMO03183.1 helix-turn-helix transcriptional regulator [Gordonia asplenii]